MVIVKLTTWLFIITLLIVTILSLMVHNVVINYTTLHEYKIYACLHI